jgi:hypothetical protein
LPYSARNFPILGIVNAFIAHQPPQAYAGVRRITWDELKERAMDMGDAVLITGRVWSNLGLVPGVLVFGSAVLFFSLLDRMIGSRIAGRWRRSSHLDVMPSGFEASHGDALGRLANAHPDVTVASDCGPADPGA